MVVLKWPIGIGPTETLDLPKNARIVHVDVDGAGRVCIWTVSENDVPAEPRTFIVLPTGLQWRPAWSYVGTARDTSDPDAVMFWHVCELLDDPARETMVR
jgi:hypothetical protein